MDFYDLLKKASLNQKKAEKELESNKRYSLKFAPMKKIERPKVNREAIAAQLKKKEEEEKKKAELEERKKQAVLALRAEQEAAKSSKRRRDSSSVDSSQRKKENVSEEQKKLDRRAKREDWYENRKLEESNNDSSEDEEEEQFTQKSRGSKSEPEVKQTPKALSFKELMALAASNAKGEKLGEETQTKKNGECESKVKLKSHQVKGEVRDRGEKHRVNKVVTTKTSKVGEVQRSVERVKSSQKINNPTSKPSSSARDCKSTLFPNTKSHSAGTGSSTKGLSSQSKPSRKLDKGSKSLASDSKRTPPGFRSDEMRKHDGDRRKLSGGNQVSHHQSKAKGGLPDPVKETTVGAKQVGKTSQKSHHTTKRNGGWLDPVEKAPPVAKQAEKASQKSHHPPNRKGGWLDPVKKNPPVEKQVVQAREKSHHPPKRKGGWLDPVKKNPPVETQVGRASEKSHHPAKRKGGWLDQEEDTPVASQKSHHPPKRKGGWLDPVENTPVASQNSHHPPKRKGGWLDPVGEPAVTSGHIEKTSKDNSKHVRESIEKKGLAAGRNGAKVSKGDRFDPVQSTPSKNKVLHSQSKEKKSLAAPSSSASAKMKSPGQVKERKRGWLDPAEGEEPPLREERGRGGWLGPVKARNHQGPPPAKGTGGWLGPSVEPSFSAKRGRLLSSEDEEEDSDMDGFIDDTPLEEEGADVSSYIKEIFGYDKSKYGYESDYALRSMEASYSQILKEEARSARIAMQEDAEEFRKEQEREKMKKLARAKKK